MLLKLYKMPIFIYWLKYLTIPQCRLMINQYPANQSMEFRSNQHLMCFVRAAGGEGFQNNLKSEGVQCSSLLQTNYQHITKEVWR